MAQSVLPLLSVSFVGLVSIAVVRGMQKMTLTSAHILRLVTAMGAGALLGDALGHLLPDSFLSSVGVRRSAITFVAVILLLSATERSCQTNTLKMVIFGNYAHNFCDGLLIGSSFLMGSSIGLLSTLAILLHEIPHELGVFGIMVDEGVMAKKATITNGISALIAIAGTAAALLLGARVRMFALYSQPAVASVFVYIACTDLLPSFKNNGPARRAVQLATTGVSAVFIIVLA